MLGIHIHKRNPSGSERMRELEAKIDAIGRSQAVIEFSLQGVIIWANENFTHAMGYTLDEIVGQHHRMFVDDVGLDVAEYKAFWQDLNAGT